MASLWRGKEGMGYQLTDISLGDVSVGWVPISVVSVG